MSFVKSCRNRCIRLLLLSLLILTEACGASTTRATLDADATSSSLQTIQDHSVFFIIHPYKGWDYYESAREGLNTSIAKAQSEGLSLAYVLDSKDPVYLNEQNPDYAIMGPTGQFSDPVESKSLFLAGGNWGYCLSNALGGLLINKVRRDVEVTILTESTFIFMNPKNLAEYLVDLPKDARNREVLYEFQQITDRIQGQYCLNIYYEGMAVGRTKGACVEEAKIMLLRKFP